MLASSFKTTVLLSAILSVSCVNGLRGGGGGEERPLPEAVKVDADADQWERDLQRTYSPTFAPTDITDGPDGDDSELSACFSAGATVQVLGEGAIPMTELRVGDKVLTGKGTYSMVYSFAHYAPHQKGDFLQIRSSSRGAAPLEISKEHMLFVKGQDAAIRADEVNVGDVLLDQSTGTGATVTKIKKLSKSGLFAPLTLDGTVVVDDMVASCYIDLQQEEDAHEEGPTTRKMLPFGMSQHTYVHWGMSPMRLVCGTLGPESLCNTYNQDGYPYFVALALKIHQFAASQPAMVEYWILSLILIATGTIHLLECILLDASWILSLSVICILVLARWTILRRQRSLN